MLKEIKKRDGTLVPFTRDRIANAIFAAAKSVDGQDFETSKALADEVVQKLEEKYAIDKIIPTVEDTQDLVENVLIDHGHKRTAKKYILYREERNRTREYNILIAELMRTFKDLTFADAKECDIKRENANIDGDTAMGTMLKYGSESSKLFSKKSVLIREHSEAHKNGDIHIHDLDFFNLTTTCCQIDLLKLFRNGFSTGHGHLREPNNIASYSALACIAIQSNQNDQHGGQSVPNFDYAMAEGIRKTYRQLYAKNIARAVALYADRCDFERLDETIKSYMDEIFQKHGVYPTLANNNGYAEAERIHLLAILNAGNTNDDNGKLVDKIMAFTAKLTIKETNRATFQAMEALVHNLNTMNSRAGAQTPFSSINYGTDTSPEGRMAIENILLANEKGLGNSETPIFPIHIFKIKEGINYNPDDPNYDLFKLACRVSAQRLYPNFSFIDAPFNLKYYKEGDYDTEVAYMGCRTRVIGNVYDKSRSVVCGRGNISFTTINLPRLALRAEKDIDKFFLLLDEMLTLVIKQLSHRFGVLSMKSVKNFPFLMGSGVWIDSDGLGREDCVGEILKHGTMSVGYIGLAECLYALIGKHHGECAEAQQLGLQIVSTMRERLDEISEERKLNYTLLATPAEGVTGRFAEYDRERFGIIPNITDREYYTNSFHVPVHYDISVYNKIKTEAPYHDLSNAGHISYVEIDGNPLDNIEAFEKIVRIMKESGVGFGAVNHPVDYDPVCGFTGVIDKECPKCGRKEKDGVPFNRIRRVTGYLVGSLERFNNAKQAEVRDRIRHRL